MPFEHFKLNHQMAPIDCLHSPTELIQRCSDLIAKIEASFPLSCCLGKCHSSAQTARKALLDHFQFPTHKENGKRLINRFSATSHQRSSVLYLLRKRHLPAEALMTTGTKTGKPKTKKRDDLFKEYSQKCTEIRGRLKVRCSVVIYSVPEILTIHTLEALLSLEFKTGPWNSFRPH